MIHSNRFYVDYMKGRSNNVWDLRVHAAIKSLVIKAATIYYNFLSVYVVLNIRLLLDILHGVLLSKLSNVQDTYLQPPLPPFFFIEEEIKLNFFFLHT